MKFMLRFSLVLAPVLYTGMMFAADPSRVLQLEARVAALEGCVNYLMSRGGGVPQPQQVWAFESSGFGYSNIRTTSYSQAQAKTEAHHACQKAAVTDMRRGDCVKGISCRIEN